MTNWEELEYRGLIKDVAGSDIEDLINNKSITFYWGTDPTADSLHLGHYSSLITAKRLMKMGHKPILLCGGATGRIGDPRPTAEREMIDIETINNNIKGIKKQIDEIFDHKAKLVDNYDWLKDMNIMDFLRDVGKYINVNYMLNKDIINRRLETGITFAEFAYTLLQGYDFLHLFETENCIMQAAGQDQWGNITTGIDLINKKTGKTAYAFTMPLILDASGKKFGKSEGNALWLDKNKTSSYELYQYLINTDDSKVLEYLKVFTFLSKEEIENIMLEHSKKPEERLAQKTLAHEIIRDLHGEDEYLEAYKLSNVLFSGDVKNLTSKEIEEVFKGVMTFTIENDLNVLDFLVNHGIVSSKREGREFLNSNSITINGNKVNSISAIDAVIHDEYVIVRRGKKKYFLGIYK